MMADHNVVDRTTRILAGDDQANYDNVAIALHWITAVLVVTQFALGETWDWFPQGVRRTMQRIHISFGILFTAVIVIRLMWRWIPAHWRSSLAEGWMRTASRIVHYVLYALLAAQALLGLMVGWGGGAIRFFGIPLASPIDPLDQSLRNSLLHLHEKVAWTIIILVVGHAGAALYHHYFLKDRVLGRMLPLARKS
jgi:cytochrome b561